MHDTQTILYLYVYKYFLFIIFIYSILTLNFLGLSYVEFIPLDISECSSLRVIYDDVSIIFRLIVSLC